MPEQPKPVDLGQLRVDIEVAYRCCWTEPVRAVLQVVPALVAELQAARGLIVELRNCLPLPPIGGEPERLADLQRRSAVADEATDAAKGGG